MVTASCPFAAVTDAQATLSCCGGIRLKRKNHVPAAGSIEMFACFEIEHHHSDSTRSMNAQTFGRKNWDHAFLPKRLFMIRIRRSR